MRISLNFINKNQSVFFILHFISCKHTDLQIKIFNGFSIFKKAVAQRIGNHIDFYIVFKKFFTYMVNDVGFANLTGTVD